MFIAWFIDSKLSVYSAEKKGKIVIKDQARINGGSNYSTLGNSGF